MILIDEADAAAADNQFVRIQKPVVMRNFHNPCLRVSDSIEELLNTTMDVRCNHLSLVWRPGKPGLSGWIATLKREATVFSQMMVGSS